jgi:Protein of unknown function (DUF2569)
MTQTTNPDIKQYEGLGGWLILVILGLIIWPIRNIFELIDGYAPFADSAVWKALFDSTSPVYNPGVAIFIIAEILVNIGLLVACAVAVVYFFQKRLAFPKLYICILAASVVILISDAIIVSFLVPDETAFDGETIKSIGRSIFNALIWIPYILFSKRVEATFVN